MTIMATITLNYDARNVAMKKAIDLILSMGATKVEDKASSALIASSKKKQSSTRKMTRIELSMQEAREGKVHHFDTVEEMFQSLGI